MRKKGLFSPIPMCFQMLLLAPHACLPVTHMRGIQQYSSPSSLNGNSVDSFLSSSIHTSMSGFLVSLVSTAAVSFIAVAHLHLGGEFPSCQFQLQFQLQFPAYQSQSTCTLEVYFWFASSSCNCVCLLQLTCTMEGYFLIMQQQ